MAIKKNKRFLLSFCRFNKGLSLLEFCVAMAVLLPFIYNVLGIMEYYRLSYLLEEKVDNAFGNRKEFVLKLDENFTVIKESKDNIKNLINDKLRKLRENNHCEIKYDFKLIKSTKNYEDTLVKRNIPQYFITLKSEMNFKECARMGGDFLNLMPNDIIKTKQILVTYEF
ncbi:MAG: hypothetical protein ACOX3T_02140 [Bdellovibrionota bacterium]